jgi:Zn-dependent M32 family carboxypeptidase
LRVHRNYADGSADKMKAIRENADDIFEAVEELLFNKLKASSSRIDDDELTYGLSIIMVDAFMRCKILENPPKSS